ncbi:MAG TPA: MFS transporter [Gaiellaceae bacterium]|nr:MFS transporter [Gaiellaceae bacterium]
MADPVTNVPEEARVGAVAPPRSAFALLRRRDFRRVYVAVSASELGDALQYIALMWFAFEAGGPLGVLAVRLADSVPALLFGLHGGLVADRWDRRRVLIGADLVRAAVLIPVAAAGLAGELPLWGLVVAAFLLTAATSYFDPAYGALLPALVERRNIQQANGLVRATAEALSVGGWAVAAGLLAFLPVSVFFAVNAATFLVSAAVLAGVRTGGKGEASGAGSLGELAAGFHALRARPFLAAAVVALGLAVTIAAGTWIAGTPQLVSENLDRAAGGFALVMTGYALGAIAAGAFLTRRRVRRKALGSLVAWSFYLPAYLVIGLAGSVEVAMAGAFLAALGESSAVVLLNSAAQEEVPDRVLGRVMGVISLVHRGAHATGLLLVAPLFAVLEPSVVFAGAALALPLVGLGCAAWALATARAAAAPAPATGRSPRA